MFKQLCLPLTVLALLNVPSRAQNEHTFALANATEDSIAVWINGSPFGLLWPMSRTTATSVNDAAGIVAVRIEGSSYDGILSSAAFWITGVETGDAEVVLGSTASIGRHELAPCDRLSLRGNKKDVVEPIGSRLANTLARRAPLDFLTLEDLQFGYEGDAPVSPLAVRWHDGTRDHISDQWGIRLVQMTPADIDFTLGHERAAEAGIDQPYFIAVTELTRWQHALVRGTNPSWMADPDLPASSISWNEAAACTEMMSTASDGLTYQLPSEIQWQEACEVSTHPEFALDRPLMWHSLNSGDRAHPVGTTRPNALGVFDLKGNLFEWCRDAFTPRLNDGLKPGFLASSSSRSRRGGTYSHFHGMNNCGTRWDGPRTMLDPTQGVRFIAVDTPPETRQPAEDDLPTPTGKLPEAD